MDEPLEVAEDSTEGSESKLQEWLSARAIEFERDRDADRENREEAYDDIRFIADPASQWDERDRQAREKAGRPCPALNRLSPFVKQVSNTIRRNKPEINLSPVESNDRNAVEVFGALIDHIERNSDAKIAYSAWANDGVECGIGHVRAQIEQSEAGHMEVRFEHIADPLSVIWDRTAARPDRRDARRCWVIDYMDRETLLEAYPDAQGEWPDEEESTAWSDWYDTEDDQVRICEYYELRNVEISTFQDELTGETFEAPAGQMPDGNAVPVASEMRTECRAWLMTAGHVLEGGEEGILIPGGQIPIFTYIPHERRLGRRKIRKGLIRDAKDSVRMINWSMALMIEAMAATPKPKWTGPAKAFEGYEEHWEQAATSNRAYLPWNDASPQAPAYNVPPLFNGALVSAMQVFDENIKQVTGIYDASLGARSNETSGTAIRAREEQGDTATFDYIDTFNQALTVLGRWLVRVIPDVYTESRMIRIVGEGNQEAIVEINGYDVAQGQPINPVERVAMDVSVKAGPGFSTQREAAAETIRMAIQAAPQLAPILLDVMMENEDWPGAERAARRLSAMLPPQIQAMESGQPMPEPKPDPKDVADADEKTARAEKTRAETRHIELETRMMQLEAILQRLPPQLIGPLPNGGMGTAASPMGGFMPGNT